MCSLSKEEAFCVYYLYSSVYKTSQKHETEK